MQYTDYYIIKTMHRFCLDLNVLNYDTLLSANTNKLHKNSTLI